MNDMISKNLKAGFFAKSAVMTLLTCASVMATAHNSNAPAPVETQTSPVGLSCFCIANPDIEARTYNSYVSTFEDPTRLEAATKQTNFIDANAAMLSCQIVLQQAKTAGVCR